MITTIDNVTLIGTAHVSKKSADLVKNTINELNPEVVAIELDSMRLKTLLEKHSENASNSSKKKSKQSFFDRRLIKQIGMFGFMFLKVSGYLQQKMGKTLQIEPGVDMLAGVIAAKENEIPLCLADKPILKTISEFKKLSFLQKMGMIKRMIFTEMSFEERKDLAKKLQKGELDNQVINEVISQLKDEVPELYDILIHGRNVYMANEIIKLRKNGKKNIVLVIGAGHLPGILEILEEKLPKFIEKEEMLVEENSNESKVSFKLE